MRRALRAAEQGSFGSELRRKKTKNVRESQDGDVLKVLQIKKMAVSADENLS
jgi:hypothetical protein